MNTDTSRNFEIWVEKKCESSWKKVWVELKKNESRVEKNKLSRERENADQWYCQSMFSLHKPVPGSQIVGMTRQCVSVLPQFREPDYLRAWNRLSLHRDEAYIQSSGSLAARCWDFSSCLLDLSRTRIGSLVQRHMTVQNSYFGALASTKVHLQLCRQNVLGFTVVIWLELTGSTISSPRERLNHNSQRY